MENAFGFGGASGAGASGAGGTTWSSFSSPEKEQLASLLELGKEKRIALDTAPAFRSSVSVFNRSGQEPNLKEPNLNLDEGDRRSSKKVQTSFT